MPPYLTRMSPAFRVRVLPLLIAASASCGTPAPPPKLPAPEFEPPRQRVEPAPAIDQPGASDADSDVDTGV